MTVLVCTVDNEVTEAVRSTSTRRAVTRLVNRPTTIAFIDIEVYHEAIRRHRETYVEHMIRERTA
jgi:hypothetical protein